MRIAFKARTSVTAFDPTKIQLDTEAVVLDNIYSPLVRIAVDGTIEPFFAEHYHWDGNSLHFGFRNNFKTVDGWPVTAQDAEFSLRRVLESKSNAHGDLGRFLCPEAKNIDSTDTCDGIRATETELVLTVVDSKFKPFLLKLLATMDFGIIPKAACNQKSKTKEIIDYRNTTGPYYVGKDDPHGAFVLEANPAHWLFEKGYPRTLEFIPSEPLDAIDKIKNGEVDFISCVNVEPSKELETLRLDERFNFFETYPIRKLLIATSRSQLNDFSPDERMALFQQIREAFFQHEDSTGWKPSLDFYPSLGEGALTAQQLGQLKSKIAEVRNIKLHRKVTLGVFKKRAKLFESVLKSDPNIQVVIISNMAPFLPESERPDFYITGTDSSFHESYSLVSYNVLAELVDLPKENAGNWVNEYISREKDERVEMLRNLNLQTLMSGVIGVIGEAPYIEVSRRPIKYDGSKFFAGSPLWLIRQD